MSFFVTGTDTGIGKTVATALLAKKYQEEGLRVVTQKWVQCGNLQAPDLAIHDDLGDLDTSTFKGLERYRAPYSFDLAASPHLASQAEGIAIDEENIRIAFMNLELKFDRVIVEGAGGLLVPYSRDGFLIDIVKDLQLPVVVVIANRVGCLNHSLLTIEALRARELRIKGLVFNTMDANLSETIALDNKRFILEKTELPLLLEIPFEEELSA